MTFLSLNTQEESGSTLGHSPHTVQAEASACLWLSLSAVRALGTAGNSVQLWLWVEQHWALLPSSQKNL